MRILKCYICSSKIYPGHGTTFIRNDSVSFSFCRSKCHKIFKRKRNPRRIKWTKAYRHLHNKEIPTIVQTSLLEQKRTEPIVYDRGLFSTVYENLDRVVAIEEMHKSNYIKNRMLEGRAKMKKHEIAFIKKHSALCKRGELYDQMIDNKNVEYTNTDEKPVHDEVSECEMET